MCIRDSSYFVRMMGSYDLTEKETAKFREIFTHNAFISFVMF